MFLNARERTEGDDARRRACLIEALREKDASFAHGAEAEHCVDSGIRPARRLSIQKETRSEEGETVKARNRESGKREKGNNEAACGAVRPKTEYDAKVKKERREERSKKDSTAVKFNLKTGEKR